MDGDPTLDGTIGYLEGKAPLQGHYYVPLLALQMWITSNSQVYLIYCACLDSEDLVIPI
jgi:hypothetical protein